MILIDDFYLELSVERLVGMLIPYFLSQSHIDCFTVSWTMDLWLTDVSAVLQSDIDNCA